VVVVADESLLHNGAAAALAETVQMGEQSSCDLLYIKRLHAIRVWNQ
jgi:hypothetical protein